MKPPQKEHSESRKPKQYPVFDKHGSVFYSNEPAHNPETQWVWDMCKAIRDEYLTPLMVVVQHARLSSPLLQPRTMLVWSDIDRFHLWPLAGAGSSLERTLMQQGKQQTPWSDDNAWTYACDAAEKKWRHPSRFEGIDMTDPGKLLRNLVKTMAEQDVADYDAKLRGRVDRQLEAAKAVGLL